MESWPAAGLRQRHVPVGKYSTYISKAAYIRLQSTVHLSRAPVVVEEVRLESSVSDSSHGAPIDLTYDGFQGSGTLDPKTTRPATGITVEFCTLCHDPDGVKKLPIYRPPARGDFEGPSIGREFQSGQFLPIEILNLGHDFAWLLIL
jgi:hypothetical protein